MGKGFRSIVITSQLAICGLLIFVSCAIAENRKISDGEYWFYEGDAVYRLKSGACHANRCYRYCFNDYCAHGQGTLGTDGGMFYWGAFVEGRMNGYGTYETDFYTYEGEFKDNEFHGRGRLSCGGDSWYEGEFDNGKLVGDFKIMLNGKLTPFKTKVKPGTPVGWEGPCSNY